MVYLEAETELVCQGKMGFFDQSYHIPCIIADPRPAADTSRGSVVEAFSE